jgi:hypothetical protein
MSQPIFALEARGNIMRDVLQGYFDLNRAQMRHAINATHSFLCGDLIGENNMQDRFYDAFQYGVYARI